MRAERWAPLAIGLLWLSGCASLDGAGDLRSYAWPPGDPRVSLERLITTRRDAGAGRAAAWLSGQKHRTLFTRPYGAVWAGDDLIVTDPGAGRVLRIRSRGGVDASPEGLLSGPIGVADCPPGIVVTDPATGRVGRLDGSLQRVEWLAEGLHRPTGVACVADAVFVVETARHRIVSIAPDGGLTVIGGRGETPSRFNFPAALAIGDDSLWVGDTLNFRVQSLTLEGQPLSSFGSLGDAAGETPRVKGLAVDLNYNLWVSDAHLDQVSLFDADGRYLMSIGRSGEGPAEFSFPAGIAAHADGRVAVVDSLNRRVKVFRVLAGDPGSGRPSEGAMD